MKLKFFLTILLSNLLLVSPVFAAREIPKNQPLLPAPTASGPNVSNNINSPNSDINQNLQSQIPTPEPEPNPDENTSPDNPDQPLPIVSDVHTPSVYNYWVIFFIGLAGLMGAVVWSYLRFIRKQS